MADLFMLKEEGGVDVKRAFSSVSPHFTVNLKKGNFMISVKKE